jgi:hypothetical protein
VTKACVCMIVLYACLPIGMILGVKYIKPKPKEEFILSVSRGDLWLLSSLHRACLHTVITVPPEEVKSIVFFASIGITKYGATTRLKQWMCNFVDTTETLDITTGNIQFFGCTPYLLPNITSSDTVVVDGVFDIKMKHKSGNLDDWSREQHLFPDKEMHFSGVIDRPVVNFCHNKTFKGNCPFRCDMTCMDVLTGNDRLFCDTQIGSSLDAKYIGTGSPEYNYSYVPVLAPRLESVRNGSLFFRQGQQDPPPYNLLNGSSSTTGAPLYYEHTHDNCDIVRALIALPVSLITLIFVTFIY